MQHKASSVDGAWASGICAIVFLSGVAGLGYQVLWVRMLAVGLGHEFYAVLAVVAAFFMGLAIGALVLDRRISLGRYPGRWYAVLELIIALWAIALVFLIPAVNDLLARMMGPEPNELWRWGVAFGGSLVLMLPATVAMGATIPAAERLYARRTGHGRGLGALYSANTIGAVGGIVLTVAIIAPALGHTTTLVVFAAVNVFCGIAVLAGPARREAARRPLVGEEAGPGPRPLPLVLLALTGFLGIGFEVAGVRAIAQILENTVYSFAAALAVYLTGTAIGAALFHAWGRQRGRVGFDSTTLAVLAAATGLMTALGTLGLLVAFDAIDIIRGALGQAFATSIAIELFVAAIVFGPASVAMGALFTHLAQSARGVSGGLGYAIAANTAGAATAPLVLGPLVIPLLGAVETMATLSLGYLLVLLSAGLPRVRPAAVSVMAMVVIAAVMAGPFERRLVIPTPGGAVVEHLSGAAASASVVSDPTGELWLRVNGTFTMGGTATYRLDRLQAHLALMMHPRPKRALFLGVGTGATLAGATAYGDLETTGVELSPEVLALLPNFRKVNHEILGAWSGVHLAKADARRYTRTVEGTFDVILADTYHPARDGAGLLYTREHFMAIRDKLAAGGLFVQWLPLHQLDLETLRIIVRTYLEIFPSAVLSMGNYNVGTPLLALWGSADGALPQLRDIAGRQLSPDLRRALTAVGLETPYDLLGGFMAGADALHAFAGSGPLNTDDRPLVMYRAPVSVYAPLSPAVDRLRFLTDQFDPVAKDVVDLTGMPDSAQVESRLEAFWQARDAFIALGSGVRLTGNAVQDARALAPRLLEIVAISPDFRPAVVPLRQMARRVAVEDPRTAQTIIAMLARLQGR